MRYGHFTTTSHGSSQAFRQMLDTAQPFLSPAFIERTESTGERDFIRYNVGGAIALDFSE
jgi:hypothetical protein